MTFTSKRRRTQKHVLAAAANDWLLLTHNERDFILLFDAWHRWADAWNVHPEHAGILTFPHWPLPVAETMLTAFLAGDPDLRNRLYVWRSVGGWRSIAYHQ